MRHVTTQSVIALAAAVAAAASVAAPSLGGASHLDGVYRVSWTESQLLAAGAPPSFAKHNHSVITMTMKNGKFSQQWSVPPNCYGEYVVHGSAVRFQNRRGCHGWAKARWTIANGFLRLQITAADGKGDAILMGGKPWKKLQ
jgi:hypothetical protein